MSDRIEMHVVHIYIYIKERSFFAIATRIAPRSTRSLKKERKGRKSERLR